MSDLELIHRLEEMRVNGRDIYEVANQLEGWVGPNTEERLAQFLLREGQAASDLADEIVRLHAALAEARDKALEEVESLLLSSANDMLRLKSTEMAIANNLSLHFVERHNWYCGVAENVRALKEKP